jgi:glycosyltransferase involved in cell wall biosynthesis
MNNGPVVHVIAPSLAGGAESVVLALASGAKERTHVVILNQMAHSETPLQPLVLQLRQRGVKADEIRCGRRQYSAEARSLAEHLRGVGASLVHTHGYHATWVGHKAAAAVGLPAVATVHGYLTRSLKERVYNALDRRLLRRFDAVIAVSLGIRDQLVGSGVPPERVHFIQNGLVHMAQVDRASARRALDIGLDQRVVGWIGRLSEEKGPDLFIRGLAASGVPLRGVVIGEGPELQRLVSLARDLGLSEDNRVRFAGFRPDASELIPAFDVIALTSRMEGTPMVIMEAVAAGVPIVSFAVGGIPDLLSDDSAWIVPPGNVDALADALRHAYEAPERGMVRARAARSRLADRLSPEQWLRRVWKVYDLVRRPS